MNRLAAETSLYLKQHAANPVDWFPWGPEALALAKAHGKPIFLSIGYSACHWCHVMEHESFEDDATAALMNEQFVCIKVDREERPDLDQIYMTSLQLLTREGGGWPLSVFLTPELTPFYAGTYFPPREAYGRPSFRRLLTSIADAWTNRRADLIHVGEQVAQALKDSASEVRGGGELAPDILRNAGLSLARIFDRTHGGFGGAPKFPHALELHLLLRLHRRFPELNALPMATLTLEKMARGGMYDQVGGGFHRYSVDERWLVPHFEKMLYDNALLAGVYLEAFAATRQPFYEQVCRETLDYALGEMLSPVGFYSAQDADSEGVEGKFFVWTEAEIDAVLPPDLATLAKEVWGTSAEGNFEGKNILCRWRSDEEEAARRGEPLAEFQAKLKRTKQLLYVRRGGRIAPGRDEKILTAWNALMIGRCAQAGVVLGEDKYLDAAKVAADFIAATMRTPEGRLYRTCGVGHPPKLAGYLDDHAYFADATLTLYECTGATRWFDVALQTAELMLKHFADEAHGGFFYTADDHEHLIARTKDLHDGSTPSGNAVAVQALSRLAAFTGRADFRDFAEHTLAGQTGLMAQSPAAAGQMLLALDRHLGPCYEVAVIGPKNDAETQKVLAHLRGRLDPFRVLAYHDPSAGEATIPLLKDRPMKDGRVTVYVCRDFTCAAPLVGYDDIAKSLGGRPPEPPAT